MCPPGRCSTGTACCWSAAGTIPGSPAAAVFLIRNSGGDGRDGYLAYAYVQAYMNDAAWIDAAGLGR